MTTSTRRGLAGAILSIFGSIEATWYGGRTTVVQPVPSPTTLADALWDARLEQIVVDDRFEWSELSVDAAHAVATELGLRHARAGDVQMGWKLGATDPAVQEVMGSDGPFRAPIFTSTVLRSGASVSQRSFVAPVLEIELAFTGSQGNRTPIACIEIADSRYGRWQLTLAEAIADFGLHGAIVLGTPPESWPDRVTAALSRDGAVITCSEIAVSNYDAAVEHASERFGAFIAPYFVAAGSIGPPVPLSSGVWRADFGPVGAVDLTITA